jgi:hypothetical protein
MPDKASGSASEQLQQLEKRLDEWRAVRAPRLRLPEELWAAAVGLFWLSSAIEYTTPATLTDCVYAGFGHGPGTRPRDANAALSQIYYAGWLALCAGPHCC